MRARWRGCRPATARRWRIFWTWIVRQSARQVRSSRRRMGCWSGGWGESCPGRGAASFAPHRRAGTQIKLSSKHGPRLSSASFHAAQRPGHANSPLALFALLGRNRSRPALRADDADLIAVDDAVGWRVDDAVFQGDARGQFDIASDLARDVFTTTWAQ